MANEGDALIREVQEELRRDQLKKMWDNYGTYIIAAVAVVLAGVGAFNWWQASSKAAAEAAGAKFEQALNLAIDTKKTAEADKALTAIAGSGAPGYATLARLTLAGEAVETGKTADAATAYEAAAGSTSEALLKDFASLQAASLKIDSADWTEMQNRLKDLTVEANPWRNAARELLGIAALRAGKLAEARQLLAALSADPLVSAAARERTGALMNLVVAAESEKTAPKTVELEPAAAPPKDTPEPAGQAPVGGAAGTGKPATALDRLKQGGGGR